MKHPWRYRAEYLAAQSGLALLSALPLPAASATASWIARAVGSRLPISERAKDNLGRALSELASREVDDIVGEMWENLGRLVGEMAHLDNFHIAEHAGVPGAIEVVGTEHIENAIRSKSPVIFFSGHIGNWELTALTASLLGGNVHVVYRAANNPLVDQLIRELRHKLVPSTIPKGASGARKIMKLLKDGHCVGMLVDQKMNDGIAVPFFGRKAMTAPALAQLAYRFDASIIPTRCERLAGSRFRVTFDPPMELPRSDDRVADVLALMSQVNALLECWIRKRPNQWLWLHRRW